MKPTLVVLAAGVGSRYGGLKQIDSIGLNGATIIDYSIFDAIRSGFGKVVFIIRNSIEAEFKEVFKGKFDHLIEVEYVFQELDFLPNDVRVHNPERTKPWGTTHALWCARDAVFTPFAVLNADDFYGKNSFELAGRFLNQISNNGDQYALIGYRLDSTLSSSGTVARGVCQVNTDNYLTDIVEQIDLARLNSGKIACRVDSDPVFYKGDEPVSMNFWCLSPEFFNLAESKLKHFFIEKGNELKSECLLPNTVKELIEEKKVRVKVLKSTSEWIGVTYLEDKKEATNKIKVHVESGEYPPQLWF